MKKILFLALAFSTLLVGQENYRFSLQESLQEREVPQEYIDRALKIVGTLSPNVQNDVATELQQPYIGKNYIEYFTDRFNEIQGDNDLRAVMALNQTQRALLYSVWLSYATPAQTPRPAKNPILEWNRGVSRRQGNFLNP